MVNTGRPTLYEDKDNYYLCVHYNDRDRAKGIGRYRWDPAGRRWIYPRDARILSALIAEFGDELDMTQLRLTPTPSKSEAVLQGVPKVAAGVAKQATVGTAEHVDQLQHELDAARREAAQARGEVARLTEALSAARADLATRSLGAPAHDLDSLQARIEALTKERDDAVAQAEGARMVAEAALKEQVGSGSDACAPDEHIKKVALDASGGDRAFAKLLEDREMRDMPLVVARRLEEECRQLLRTREQMSFVELLTQVRDADFLSPEALDLAHVVRKQRNVAAHSDQARSQREARAIVTLMSAALLWPEIVEARKRTGSS